MERSPPRRNTRGVSLPQDAILAADANALLVVVVTNGPEQVVSEDLLEAPSRRWRSSTTTGGVVLHRQRCPELPRALYASSASELVTELLQYLLEARTCAGARPRPAGGDGAGHQAVYHAYWHTHLEAAAFLRRSGADTGT